MREPAYQPSWSMWSRLMAAIVGVFVLQIVTSLATGPGKRNLFDFLVLNSDGPFYFWPFQLFTFQFLHSTSNILHILFNCLMLYFLGSALEDRLGSRAFLKLYLSCGVVGGLVQILFGVLFPQHFGGGTVGASAGIMGLLGAFALLNWEQRLTILLFFILPVTIVAKYLILAAFIMIGLEILMTFNQPAGMSGGIAHGAHLGGLLMGLAFVKFFLYSRISFDWSKIKSSNPKPRRELVRSRRTTSRSWVKPQPPVQEEELPPSEFISREVDPILDKISAHGIHSLTERERKILEAARNRMGGKR